MLIFFNNPLIILDLALPTQLIEIMSGIFQASFLAMILFFWLLLVHSISSDELLEIDYKRFVMPKYILCGLVWLDLVGSIVY